SPSRYGARAPPRLAPMSIKYYTHFLMQERAPRGLSEFRGVVEVNRVLPRGDLNEAASVLAKYFECQTKDIKVLQWTLLQSAAQLGRIGRASQRGTAFWLEPLRYPLAGFTTLQKVRFCAPGRKLGVFFARLPVRPFVYIVRIHSARCELTSSAAVITAHCVA